MSVKAKYNDLFTGEEKLVVFESEKLSPNQEWLKKSNYRKVSGEESCMSCKFYHYKFYGHKCEKVGITDGSASNIDIECVCDNWKVRRKR